MVAGHPKRWDQVLQSTMFALRTKKQLTTKYSPYYLMFGREARYPSEVPEEYLVKEDKVSKLVEREEIHEGLKKQEAVFTEVKINMKRSQDKVRKRKVERGQEDNFQVGDQVLRRNVRQEQRKGGKLEDDWLGPFSILELEGKGHCCWPRSGSHGHWTLIIMYLKERRSLFVDPFGATDAQIDRCKDVTG
ncbi:hypothetical protein KUCAC02_026479 [Chaenocephalus aceratus]|uniref:Uncharacterized protein n=1 Tax=Chaenocephalus aceratus TaxID=36190 RepID=A0ACB9VXN6_CHAAC|nr:hypothetical protein KUCAC02_026479 [Chaenocephalus aceratus]